MTGYGQLQIHERLDAVAVQMKHPLPQIEQTKRRDYPDNAEHGRDPEHQPHVPGLGLVFVMHVVIGDGQNGAIVEQGHHHDHDRGHRVEVKDQDRQGHEKQHAQRFGDSVDRIAVHALEDAAAFLDCVDDHGQDREPGAQWIAAARAVSVAPETAMPQSAFFSAGASFTPSPVMPTMWPRCCSDVHNVELVFRKDLRETIRLFDGFCHLRRLVMLDIAQTAGIENVRSHAELHGRFPGDRHLIAGDHLDGDAHVAGARDGGFGIWSRGWIEQRQHTHHLPFVFLVCAGDSKRPVILLPQIR